MLMVETEDKEFIKELVEGMYDELPAPKKKKNKFIGEHAAAAVMLIRCRVRPVTAF